jgi:hypothetical protein
MSSFFSLFGTRLSALTSIKTPSTLRVPEDYDEYFPVVDPKPVTIKVRCPFPLRPLLD